MHYEKIRKKIKKTIDKSPIVCYTYDTSIGVYFFVQKINPGRNKVFCGREAKFERIEQFNMRVKITLACTECKQRNYATKKNKKNDPDRIEMNKYCKFCRKHTLHKETK